MISRENLQDLYPLSPLQEGMLFHWLHSPESEAYCEQVWWRLSGTLDVSLFERAWNDIVRRHDALRTVFVHEKTARPLQMVLRETAIRVQYEDLRGRDHASRASRIAAFRRGDRRRGFELTKELAFRVTVFQCADDEFEVVWTFHHIILDGWSVGVLMADLMAHYAAARLGRAPQVPAPAPFSSYIKWIEQHDRAAGAQFWREQLRGYRGVATLPSTRPRVPAKDVRGARADYEFDAGETAAIEQFARAHNVTMSTLVQALWAMVLSRYQERHADHEGDDVAFGVVVSGRPATVTGVDGMVGLLANTIPCRVRIDDADTVGSLLARMQAEALNAAEHAYLSLAETQTAAGMIDHAVGFENYPRDASLAASLASADLGFTVAAVESNEQTSYDLNLIFSPGPPLALTVFFNEARYAREQIDRVFEQIRAAASEAIAGPSALVQDLSVVSPAERSRLAMLASTGPARNVDRTLDQLILERVVESPDRIALTHGSTQLTFGDIDRASRAIAAVLRSQHGVRRGDRVGVVLPRGADLPIVFLAILRAGAVYVPFDPQFPVDRIRFAAVDSACRLVIAGGDAGQALSTALPVHVIDVTSLRENVTEAMADAVSRSSSDAAYVIYTSGSTGAPKGVSVAHRGVANLVEHLRETLPVTVDSRMVLFASPSFDASIWEICGAWGNGAALVVADAATVADPRRFGGLLREERCSIAVLPPSYARLVDVDDLSSLETLVTAGEAAVAESARSLRRRLRFINAYGPTETSIHLTSHVIEGDDEVPDSVPIGRPIPGAELHVLDERLRPVPLGAPGELCVSGVPVALGYVNRPDLTAERFPVLSTGERIYRTGDMVRWLEDGTLQFSGRRDRQVKVRGYRIELGEIEARLLAHPAVRQASVQAITQDDGVVDLVGYVVTSPIADADSLRTHLRTSLPDYMVPGQFVSLEALPLTAAGKVDRAALPAPSGGHDGARQTVTPRDHLEASLAGIWKAVLHADAIGIHDDFFSVGGHSLSAMRVASRIRKDLGTPLDLRDLYARPTIAELAALLRGRPLLEAEPITRLDEAEDYAASDAQERLWLLQHDSGNSAVYNAGGAVTLEGALDVDRLEAAIRAVIDRHESLRTTFVQRDGRPRQRVHQAFGTEVVKRVDVSGDANPEHAARHIAAQSIVGPFDLAAGPLFRFIVVRQAADRHVLIAVFHHIIADGWSIEILTREIAALYDAGGSAALAPLSVQNRDVAAWQNQRPIEGARDYWHRQFATPAPRLALPADWSRPAQRSYRGETIRFVLDERIASALSALARSRNTTTFVVLAAAIKTLLYRYTGERDVTIGHPAAGREHPELEGQVGFFVNTIALRDTLDPDRPFAHLLDAMKQTVLDALVHQHYPFERLVEHCDRDREPGRHPIFDVMVAFDATADVALALPGVTVRPLSIETRTAKFDLLFSFNTAGAGLAASIEYSSDLFARGTVERFRTHLLTLLDGIVTTPGLALARLPIVGPEERRQLCPTAPPIVFPKDTVISRFEHRVTEAADRVAVVCDGHQLTYRELNRRANQFAHYLRGRGAGPESMVALLFEPSLDTVVAILGTLKAGASYLPIDLSVPPDRIAFMIEDSKACLLVTDRALRSHVGEVACPTICLPDEAETMARQSEENPPIGAAPEHLAYCIYTSGTTGHPKGVMIEHRHVTRLFDTTADWFHFDANDTWVFFHSCAFDFSVWEIWGALLHGGRLVVVPYAVKRSPEAFHRLLCAERVTVLNQIPSAFRELMTADARATEAPSALRMIIYAGEMLDGRMLQPWIARHGTATGHINMFGPTETTVVVMYAPLAGADLVEPGSIIGIPVPDSQAYILDSQMEPVPTGIGGEIYIGGPGLCRGYLARPELTAERFVPNPFSSQPGARLYRTGDLGRYRSDGRIEYLGRADRQVKVRGFRIELTEIEVVLRRHPAVLDTVVEVVEVAGDRRLVCYLTFQPGATVTAGELRRFARESMPDYMVPASFVLVPDFPRSTTGKLDRSALIDLPGAEPLREGRGTPPATASEELIATMWAELIGTQQVDRDDSFFDIGGHSLAATRLAGRLHEAFGVEIPLRTIFEEPTLRGLGERVEALRSSFRAELPPIRRRGGHRRALSFAQQRLWFLEQLEPGAAYNVPVALRLRGSLDVAAVHAGLNQVIARHEVLRTRFVSDDGDARQEILDERAIDLRNVDLTGESTTGQLASVRRLAADQARDGFDLAAEPLMRATLARLSANDHVLILTIHHIVIDGWSIAVLLREMAAAYRALTSAEGETEPLPPLAVQYADYGDWQREWLKGQALEQQVGFWSARLAGLPPLLALPTDRPRSADRARRAEVEQVEIDRALTGDLLRLGRALNATPFMTLLAGLKVVLARHSGQDDIAIGTPVANRMRPELEPLIGFFANTVVIRTVLEDDPSFADLVGRVRSASLDAFAHQDVPFEQVVDAVQPERSLSHTPLFQVLFVLQNAPLNALDVPGLTVEPLAQPATTAKFDLTISVEERAGAFAVAVEYDADLFDRDTVRRMLRQFVQLLSAAVVEPASPVSRLPLLSRRERDELLAAAASGAARRASAVTALLDTQFASSRPAIAVDDGQRRLTYETLDREANQLARFLREGGASRERPVALCLDRSIEFIVSLLGIVKSGAGCVPLDYSYPADRLNLMLADANASLLVTRSGLVRGLATGDTRVVLIDEMRSEIASQPANPFDAGTVGDDLLYQLYTSGSTGQPKGVRVPHRVLSNLVQWSLEHGFDAPLRTLQFTPITFDVSFQEILSCWSSGGTLVLVNDEIRRDPDALLDFLRAHAIERLFLPFVALQGLADAASGRPDDELPRSLRQVITAGEQLRTTPALVQFFTRLDGCQLHNHYGPTETHVITAHHLAGPPSEWPALPPIGAAIDGAALHVLDQHLEPVPPGVPGELYAGGVVVADGYARRPELTAERFIADPFASGGRLYRTGDYVRRRADGVFEFLGRRDAQVKVRGFRVELGEIETVLTSHPAVAQAAVIADARQRLLAFVVPTAGAPVDASALRMHAKKTLPEYMVPAGFIALDALPTTSSGKVNRKALPIPDRLDAGIADDRMATIDRPRTPTEDRLHAIWQDVLGVSGVDVHESFFDVGGHSLLAARLASRIRREFGVGLPLKRLFESPTIAELAIALDASDDTVMETSVIPRAERRDEMPCSFAQERMWFLSRLEGSSGAFNMPAALRLKGALNIPALDATLSQILQRHEVLRTRFTERNGRVLQVISPEGKLSLPVIDLQDGDRTSDKESRQVIDEFVQRPFDLEHGFPIRFALVRHGAADHVLLVALHHIAADGWSLGVLAREVTTLYAANARGEASPLPALAIQYADFAAWQRERLTDAALAPHRDYWRRQLDGVPPQLTIAGMRPRPASPTFSGATVPLNVDPVRAQQLRSYAQHAGVTLSTALMTAYAATLYRLSGQDDFVIAAPIANRTRPELEPLIGFFVNQLPVRVRAAGHMGFAELSRQIQGTLLDGLAHEDLPFEKIVEDLPKKMRAEHPAPISGFVFVLQNWPRVPLDLAGVEITPEPAESRVAKFDMTMSFDDTADGLSGSLEYATDLFESATIAHLVTVFARVVDLMIETPDGKLLDARPQPTPGAGDEAEFAFDESQP